MKPIIGMLIAINDEGTISTPITYGHAIERAGGLPMVLPPVDDEKTVADFVELCDGIFFTGGADIEPARYGEQTSPNCGNITLLRDALELSVFEKAFAAKKPILGVCRGAQLVNVALGGTLYQDIPSELETDMAHQQTVGLLEFSHDVNVLPHTPLAALVGKSRIRGNSFHHQCVKALGNGLSVMATADDGVIEALWLEDDAHYLRAYQWHPERLRDKDDDAAALFEDFVKAAQKAKGERMR